MYGSKRRKPTFTMGNDVNSPSAIKAEELALKKLMKLEKIRNSASGSGSGNGNGNARDSEDIEIETELSEDDNEDDNDNDSEEKKKEKKKKKKLSREELLKVAEKELSALDEKTLKEKLELSLIEQKGTCCTVVYCTCD